MNNIELSTIYLPMLDEKYKAEAKTSVLDGDETVAKKGGNGEIKIAKLDMSALGNFDRKSGYTKSQVKRARPEMIRSARLVYLCF